MSQPMAGNGRPLPRRTPISAPYFDAAKQGQLVIPRCPRDGFFFYPRNRCPECLADDWVWEQVSGRGTLYAFTIDRVGHDPAQRSRLPLIVAAVDLDEGPRLTTNLVDCTPDDVEIGMPLEVAFEELDGEALILFKPGSHRAGRSAGASR